LNQPSRVKIVIRKPSRHADLPCCKIDRVKNRVKTMTSEELLVFGKALIWFAIPLGLAIWELWRLRRDD
jgi:hypothetical protein